MKTSQEQKSPHKTESARYRDVILPYCVGPGIEVASQGDPVCETSWNLELPEDRYAHYNSSNPAYGPIQLRGDATKKFVEGGTLSYLISSHLLEDFPRDRWPEIMKLWASALKPGGHLIILVPERTRWQAALKRGQIPNCSHRYEPFLGDVSETAKSIGLEVVEERLTDQSPEDYTILFVGRKK